MISTQEAEGFMGDYFLINYIMKTKKMAHVKMASFTISNY